MRTNMGRTDRVIRLGVGLSAIVGGILAGATSVVGIVLLGVGGIMLATSATGFCPLYRVLRISTCPAPVAR